MLYNYATILRIAFPSVKFSGTGNTYAELHPKGTSIIPPEQDLIAAIPQVTAELNKRKKIKTLKKRLQVVNKYVTVTLNGQVITALTNADALSVLQELIRCNLTGLAATTTGFVSVTPQDCDAILLAYLQAKQDIYKQLHTLGGKIQ